MSQSFGTYEHMGRMERAGVHFSVTDVVAVMT